MESIDLKNGAKSFIDTVAKDKDNISALMSAKETVESADKSWLTKLYENEVLGKIMLWYQMYDLTNQFIAGVTYFVGIKTYPGWKQKVLTATIALGGILLRAGLRWSWKYIWRSKTGEFCCRGAYMFAHLIVIKGMLCLRGEK